MLESCRNGGGATAAHKFWLTLSRYRIPSSDLPLSLARNVVSFISSDRGVTELSASLAALDATVSNFEGLLSCLERAEARWSHLSVADVHVELSIVADDESLPLCTMTLLHGARTRGCILDSSGHLTIPPHDAPAHLYEVTLGAMFKKEGAVDGPSFLCRLYDATGRQVGLVRAASKQGDALVRLGACIVLPSFDHS